jgi:hypothetical protein
VRSEDPFLSSRVDAFDTPDDIVDRALYDHDVPSEA